MQKNKKDFSTKTITKYEEEYPLKRKRFEEEDMEVENEQDILKKVRFDEPLTQIWTETKCNFTLERQKSEYLQKQVLNYQKFKQSEEVREKILEKEREELQKENGMYTENNNTLKNAHFQRVQRSFSSLLLD